MNCPLKKTFVVLTFIASIVTARATALQDASAAFAKGNYEAAVRAFETASAVEPPSADLYYDLGLARVKAGQKVRAAVDFQRALVLNPQLADAAVSLSEIQRSLGVTAQKPSWQDVLASRIPLRLFVLLGGVLFWIGMFLLLVRFFGTGNSQSLWGAIAFIVIGLSIMAAGLMSDPKFTNQNAAIVISDKPIALLATPTDGAQPVSQLAPSSTVQVLRNSGDWTYCEALDGTTGWLLSSTIEKVVPVL